MLIWFSFKSLKLLPASRIGSHQRSPLWSSYLKRSWKFFKMQIPCRTLLWWALVSFVCVLIVVPNLKSNSNNTEDALLKQCLDNTSMSLLTDSSKHLWFTSNLFSRPWRRSNDALSLASQCWDHSTCQTVHSLQHKQPLTSLNIHSRLQEIGLETLSDFSKITPDQVADILNSDFETFQEAVNNLFNDEGAITALKEKANTLNGKSHSLTWRLCKLICKFLNTLRNTFSC